MTDNTQNVLEVAQRFAAALLSLNPDALAKVSATDVSWSIAGTGRIAGVHRGVPALVAVARTVRDHGVVVTVENILVGRDGVLALLHESGTHEGRTLDAQVALALKITDQLVIDVTGYISDVSAYNQYLQ
ncbi:MAG: Ketosteroid isomerase-related protein [Subtercola sp.]|nr:Ketosteroid isomerase-related protein [Subtercola sp.]